MPMMTSYRHGVPSWTDVSSPDVEATVAFYCGLFGWDVTPDLGPDAGGYRLFLKGGLTVAGIGPNQGAPCAWSTYLAVDDIDEVAGRVGAAGGTVAVPPMDLPDGNGRIGFAVDPTGGFFGLIQAGPNHIGAQVVNEPGSVVWNELATREPDAASAFYDSLMGWTSAPMDPSDAAGYRVISVQGRVVAGLMPMGAEFPADIPTHWLTYFAVDDAQATADRCAATGGAVVQGPFPTPVGTMAVLRDPTGAVFAIGAMVNIDDPNEWTA